MFELIPYGRKRGVTLYDPFEEIDAMQRRFFGENAYATFLTDVRDNGESYLMEAELPGFQKEDLSIDIEGDQLTIRAERKAESEEKDGKGGFIKRERRYGSFSRTFDLTGIRADEITAAYENGVLKLTLPKQQETKAVSRKLEIN